MIDSTPSLFTSSSPAPPPPISDLIPSLPDDLAILCIARLPLSHYRFLAAVSRSWRNLLCSPHLFSVRLHIGFSQQFLLIHLYPSSTGQFHWYLLDLHHRNHSSPLIPLPPPPFVSASSHCSAVVLGHTLFFLGGYIDDIFSPLVQIYDFRFNSWRLGPSMLAPRKYPSVSVISGRIYVVGGCLCSNDNWAEEFDPEKQRWRRISSPLEIRQARMVLNAFVGGKLLVTNGQGGVVFDPAVAAIETELTQEKSWSIMPMPLDLGWEGRAAVVGDVLFTFSYTGGIRGYDFTNDEWMTVEGLDEELFLYYNNAILSSLGEVLHLVFQRCTNDKELEVICVGIRVTKINTGDLRGSVEWFETFVLPFSNGKLTPDFISLEF